jgi:hypothetical protein
MFGALNRFIGRLDGDNQQYSSNTPGDNSFGFQVLRNKDSDLPLEPWFDFIIGINGRLIVGLLDLERETRFYATVSNCVNLGQS